VVFSHSSEHYIRVYAQIEYGAKKADESLRNLGYILHCFNCLHRETAHHTFGSLLCPECGSKMDYAGPLWVGSIFDRGFIESMIKENKTVAFKNNARITKLLALVKEEASAPITYCVLDKLSGKLRLPSPAIQAFADAFRKNGYQAVLTHFNNRGIRTDAPALAMHKLLREITKQ
jgi:tRNA (guanine26-N2/guanine27-N2)-dimethyltransferase